MSILKKIKLGESTHQIQYTVVAPANGSVITATGSNTGDDVNANPQYELDVTVNNTLKKTDSALGTALKIVYEQATAEHGARVSLVDQDGASGYEVLSSVLVSDIVGDALGAINTRIDDNERVTAAALNDLQDAVSTLS